MTTEYNVLTCFDTKVFAEWAENRGCPVWIPLEKYRTVGPDGKTVVKTRAALTGYAFIPVAETSSLLDIEEASRFNARLLAWHEDSAPKTVSLDELSRMQKLLNEEWERAIGAGAQDQAAVFSVGDKVRCIAGPFEGLEGRVEGRKKDKGLRVLFGTLHVTISLVFLQLV